MGQRFFDEGEARHFYTYAKTGWAVLGQPGALAYQIYDWTFLPQLPVLHRPDAQCGFLSPGGQTCGGTGSVGPPEQFEQPLGTPLTAARPRGH